MLLYKLPLFLSDQKQNDASNKTLRELLAALESSFPGREFASFHGEIHWRVDPRKGPTGSQTYKYYTVKEMTGFIKGYLLGSMCRTQSEEKNLSQSTPMQATAMRDN